MGQKTYYHNITKNWFNENDYGDAVENSEVGDVIKMSFRGNALVIDLLKEDLEIENEGEYEWARKQFLDYFKEYHDVDFLNVKNDISDNINQCDHDNVELKHIRCNICIDCGSIIESDI